jgi:hypothetical protein
MHRAILTCLLLLTAPAARAFPAGYWDRLEPEDRACPAKPHRILVAAVGAKKPRALESEVKELLLELQAVSDERVCEVYPALPEDAKPQTSYVTFNGWIEKAKVPVLQAKLKKLSSRFAWSDNLRQGEEIINDTWIDRARSLLGERSLNEDVLKGTPYLRGLVDAEIKRLSRVSDRILSMKGREHVVVVLYAPAN